MKKKSIILSVVGLLAIALLIIMLTTTEDVYSTTCTNCGGDGEIEITCSDGYTTTCSRCNGRGDTTCSGGSIDDCATCGGTGLCPGDTRIIHALVSNCPDCEAETTQYQWECPLCGITGYGEECYSCGYVSKTNNHKNAPCPDCNGEGTTENPCSHGKIGPHSVTCTSCSGTGTISHECSHGYTSPHTITETCTVCNGIGHIHSGGTHANGGVCEDCGEVYETHSQGSTIDGYTTTPTGHTPNYDCTYPGCTGTYAGTEEAHSGATHANGGKCTICEYVYQNHSQSTTIDRYITDSTGHTPIYKCTEPGCTETYTGEKEAHSGGTHANGGKCTICEYVYQNHSQSTTIDRYIISPTGHTPVYKCTEPGCTETYIGEEEPHTYEDGECTICGREETITCEHKNTEYKTTTTEHWQECIDCGEEIPGTRGAHVGGTHANGGKCTTCEYVYQNHSQSTTIDRYIISPIGHTPVYKCTEPGCTETYTGEEEPHTYEDGVCTECGEKEPTEECTHENKEWHSNETEHWEECVDCGEEIPGTREPHTYQDGTCTECGEKEPTEECTHENKEWHSNETEHWEECVDCGEEIPGTREPHTYQDGTCTECGEKEPTEECTHEHRKWQASDKEHWQECVDCGEEIPGTREAHTYEDGGCTKCGIKDTTTGNKDIPFTGEKHIIWVPITILAILTICGAVELRRYQNIK